MSHNGLLEASSKQSKNRSRSNGKAGRQKKGEGVCDVCVSRGKSRTTAGQPADVEISEQTNPSQVSPVQGQVKIHLLQRPSRDEEAGTSETSRRDG